MSEAAPIIIIGAARSGTKFLRDVLSASKHVSAVPYDVNYVWRYGAAQAPDDCLDPRDLTESRRRFIRKTLQSLAQPSDRKNLFFVEKSVSNTLRIPFVAAVFPEARFIHLVRDGREVAESAMRQWQAPPDWRALLVKLNGIPLANLGYVLWFAGNFAKGILSGRGGGKVWGPRFPGIEDIASDDGLVAVCATQWVESVSAAQEELFKLPDSENRVYEIRYEDLVADENALHQLCVWLGLPDTNGVLQAFRERLKKVPVGRWRQLPQSDQQKLIEIVGPTLQLNGYCRG